MPDPSLIDQDMRRRAQAALAAGTPFIVGVTGSVAAGKSNFAAQLQAAAGRWAADASVQVLPTDGYLFPNGVLAERGLSMRKGFPESYDAPALRAHLIAIKAGARVAAPRYDHAAYDVDAADPLIVEKPGIVILDGLHLTQVERADAPRLIDYLIYLDAAEEAVEGWFTARLLPLMLAGRELPENFYYRFRELDDAGRRDFAARVWQAINLPNLRDHISNERDAADLVIRKDAAHGIAELRFR